MHPLAEYPRPAMRRDSCEILNGPWQLDIMNKAGVDWPDPMPDIEYPSITINLSTC